MNRPTTAALSALSLLSLAALTACGGDSGSGSDADKPAATATQEQQEQQATPEERLKQLAITQADAPGDRKVTEPDDEFVFAKSAKEVTVDKPACAPLALAMNQLPLGDPQADLTRVVDSGGANIGAFTYVTLTAYEPGGAEPAMSGLSKAVDACGGGFTAKSDENTSVYDSVTAEKPVAAAGDESLGFRSTLTFRGVTHTVHTQAVRSGDVLAVYFSVDGSAIANARPSDAKLPAAVVSAQNGKLGNGKLG
ncbi:hypothetical protein RI578_16880 [Streptomyces sp. BB1-1-1]|uniref:hypothetical protein n=1 Tax=Streptomyces sp. BB1-1-1 TaxID=3074430 RepID=UPI002877A4FD|nr:hypothetical protein [Streptomyces sp. BB1-1-1]WND35862.1 hypothetical protein RI578_16880 [Streptomyces sp. BB1-1-1]